MKPIPAEAPVHYRLEEIADLGCPGDTPRARTWGGLVLPAAALGIAGSILHAGEVTIRGGGGRMFVHPLVVTGFPAQALGIAGIAGAAYLHFHFFWPYRNAVICGLGKLISFGVGIGFLTRFLWALVT